MSLPEISSRVLQFLARSIDTVPRLEALLLLWKAPDQSWRAEDVAARLYVSTEDADLILRALQLRQLTEHDTSGSYRYCKEWDPSGTVMEEVADAHRRHLILITRIIHSGASAAVRDFARAFKFNKES